MPSAFGSCASASFEHHQNYIPGRDVREPDSYSDWRLEMARPPKQTDKNVEKTVEKQIEKTLITDKNHHKEFKIEKIEKPEVKEHKDLKHEKVEKNEAKEHKDHKLEKLEKNEAKEHKDAKHEKLEKIEVKEHKDAKIEKIEQKEFTKLEHGEKPQGKEKDGKEIFEGPGGDPLGDPLAQGAGGAAHFIQPEERPDLSRGALSGEADAKPKG